MKTAEELKDAYRDTISGLQIKDLRATALCAISMAMPFLIELLAEIRDALKEMNDGRL